jgi:CheY-like chemotaxis protein
MTFTILVVEDDHLIREMAVEALADAGFEVIEAATGEEAVGYCKEKIADLLFTDIRLPGTITGWVAERCREANPALPVIYATGFSAVHPRPVPGSTLFQKPYTPEQLVSAVQAASQARRAVRQPPTAGCSP